ncbi:hypothetical protein D3C76_1241380 [compost metagenome]
MKIPAMISAKINIRKPMPTPASLPSNDRLTSLICGMYFAVRPGRSVAACSHSADNGLPTSGHVATESDGGGMRMPSSRTTVMAFSTESAIEVPNR